MNLRKMAISMTSVLSLLFSFPVSADPTYVHVDDMSKIHYQMVGDGKVYFRNLDSFNSEVTGCCYAFVLDTTTSYGKSAWSTLLVKMAAKQDLHLYVSESNPPTSGNLAQITQIGNW